MPCFVNILFEILLWKILHVSLDIMNVTSLEKIHLDALTKAKALLSIVEATNGDDNDVSNVVFLMTILMVLKILVVRIILLTLKMQFFMIMMMSVLNNVFHVFEAMEIKMSPLV